MFAAIPHIVGFLGAILFGCAILIAVRILAEGRSDRNDALQQALDVVGWVLILSGIFAFLLIAGLIPAVVAAVVLPAVVHRRRRAQRYALLSAISVAAERRISLIPILLAFAAERRGYVSRRAMELAARLQAGWPLPDAVDAVGGLFPPQIRLALRMGHDSGCLAEVLDDLLDRAETTDAVDAQIAGKTTYFAIVFVFMVAIGTFVLMKIVPAMERIFDEFGIELPALTILMIQCAYFVTNYWYLLQPPLMILMLIAGYSILRYMGVFEAELPGVTWLRRRMHRAAVLETLAIFTKVNRPISDAIGALAQWYPVASVRMRLVRAHADVLGGMPWCESLARRKLLSVSDRGVLEAAERVGNLPWALAETAGGNRRRFVARTIALVQTGFVIALLGYGMLVFFFFAGNFLPLVKLISSMT